jgi:hypothetical protein
MWGHLAYTIDRFDPRAPAQGVSEIDTAAVAIRRTSDNDLPLLRDLAKLDCALPIVGPALLADVNGRPWAALGLDDHRVIADPFLPTAAAVELLRLRARQLMAAEGGHTGRVLPRWIARRARVSLDRPQIVDESASGAFVGRCAACAPLATPATRCVRAANRP